jgi:hypothetical protein
MSKTTTPSRRSLLAVLGAAILAGCASQPEIRRDTNPEARFGEYRTFAYFSPLATDRPGYQTMFTTRLKDATRRAMEARGYVYSESDPDLLINFFANVEEKQEIRTAPAPAPLGMGYYGYRRGMYGGFGVYTVDTYTYREGTLTIDLVEARRKLVIWQATAEGRVSSEARQNPGAAIDAAVTEMMSTLPARGAATGR